MKRMTNKRYKTDGFYLNCDPECKKAKCEECPDLIKAVGRFADIENILGDEYDLDHLHELVEADRNGRCAVLPVKLGSIVYVLVTDEVFGVMAVCQKMIDSINDSFKCYSFLGESVFLTREEAEAALNEMREEETE